MTYHGSYLDAQHAGLLTPLLVAVVLSFFAGWRWGRPAAGALAAATLATGALAGPFYALVVLGWVLAALLGDWARQV